MNMPMITTDRAMSMSTHIAIHMTTKAATSPIPTRTSPTRVMTITIIPLLRTRIR